MNSPADDPSTARWLKLSALCDGEAAPGEIDDVASDWAADAALRARWHAYQAIGDALRSEDLASDADHDQSFLVAFRARLEKEPVVLAPGRLASPLAEEPMAPPQAIGAGRAGRRRQRWAAPAAMAAGVMAVAGALVVIQNTSSSTATAVVAQGDGRGSVTTVAASAPSIGVGTGEMVRNPELDRYLAAHRQFAQGAALTTPSGVRQVAATPEGR